MGNAISLLVAGGSLIGTGVLALVTLITRRSEIAVDAQTNLTAGQLAFVNMLSVREQSLQKRIDGQDVEIQRLRQRCSIMEYTLRSQGLSVPSDM